MEITCARTMPESVSVDATAFLAHTLRPGETAIQDRQTDAALTDGRKGCRELNVTEAATSFGVGRARLT
jgi:hypothetical protein